MEKTKVLITGVAGLLGSHLSRYLLNKGYEVYGIDDLSGGYKEYVDPRVYFFKINLTDTKSIHEIFKCKPDYVFHFAAYAAEGLSPFIRNFNYTNNLICSTNIINECIKYDVKKLIFTSSMAVYGNNEVPFTEDMQPQPVDPYGIAKYAVEMDIKQAHEQFGLNYTIVRPHNVVGIQQNIWDKYRNVIGIWIKRILEGQSIRVFGDGEQKRAFSDIKYYLPIFERLMYEFDGETFNLGADKERTLNETAEILKEVANEFGLYPEIEHVEARHEVKLAYCNHDKAKRLLGFQDKTDLKKTIKEMVEWAKEQPERQTKSIEYELDKGMYSYWK